MIPEFHNKPCVNLRGNTWDVKHLDNFLASAWGEKLFQSKRGTENSYAPQQLPLMTSNSSIRPSAAFLSLPRTQPPVQPLEKPKGNTLIHPSSNPYTAPVLNLEKISKDLTTLEEKRIKDAQEYLKVIPPSKRKQLFEAEKHRNKEYLKLKHEKIRETKKERVLSSGYRSGVLGVDLGRRDQIKSASLGVKSTECDDKSKEIRRGLRTQNIMSHTSPSANIQFFNSKHVEGEQEKPRGLKKVEEIPSHYHNTYNTLFVTKPETCNPDRSERLKDLWRGNRNFNIISGVLF